MKDKDRYAREVHELRKSMSKGDLPPPLLAPTSVPSTTQKPREHGAVAAGLRGKGSARDQAKTPAAVSKAGTRKPTRRTTAVA
jgi:hypothetical protein